MYMNIFEGITLLLLGLILILGIYKYTKRNTGGNNEESTLELEDPFKEDRDEVLERLRLVDSIIEEQLNCYYSTSRYGDIADYEMIKDYLNITAYRQRLLEVARRSWFSYPTGEGREQVVRSLANVHPMTTYIKEYIYKLPVDYRTVEGHRYVTVQYALQYARGLKLSEEIEKEIAAKEKVEEFIRKRVDK